MHDCQRCQIPLHGHESFCPVCGLKQHVSPENEVSVGEQFKRPSSGFGPVIWVFVVLLLGGLVIYGIQNTWIGQLIKRGPVTEVEDNATTQLAAREKLENAVMQNLASQSSTGKFTYMCADKTVDRSCPQPVELTIDVNLKQPSLRKQIVDPVKSLMAPAHINTITLNDARSHATVTYSVAPSSDADAGNSEDNGSN